MRLVRLGIRNFRLLREASIRLDETQTSTILVGPNNSGKTSVAEALMLFTEGDGKGFSIYDLPVSCWGCFGSIEKAMLEEAPDVAALPALPALSMDLHFQYGNDDADLAVASDLLMDVDSSSYRVRLRIEYAVKDAKKLTKEYREMRRETETLFAFLATRMKEHYGLTLFKVAPDGSESERLEDHKILERLIKVNFVFAQRHIDDQEHSRATRLSHLLHAHYEKHYKTAEPEDHRQIEESLKAYAETLGSRYMKAFDSLIGNLRQFGYPQRRAPSMAIKAELNATTLFHDNTRIWYGPATEALLAGASPAEAAASLAPVYELPEHEGKLDGDGIVVAVSLTHDVAKAVSRYAAASLPDSRVTLDARIATAPGARAISCGRHAFQLAESLVARIKSLRDAAPVHRVYLFMAVPGAFSFFLGQCATAIGAVTLYEFDFDGANGGGYEASLSLPVVGM